MFGPVNFYTTALLGNVKLPEGSRGYLGIQSYDADRVVLPMGMLYSGCQVPFVYNGGTCPITSLNTYDPATVQNDAALPAPLRFVGLDPARRYRVAVLDLGAPVDTLQDAPPPWLADGVVLPGAVLAESGLAMPLLLPGNAIVLHLTAV